MHETQFELNPTPHNRERLLKVQANFIRYLHLAEFSKRKAKMNLFNDGDRSHKLFTCTSQWKKKETTTKKNPK